MKQLVIVNGPMGVGKSTVCRALLKRLERAVYLDGDWCWNMHPFTVNPENKAMVLRNICFLLRSFLENSQLDTVIFCWVIPELAILEQILEPMQDISIEPRVFTLVCEPSTLRRRLEADVAADRREADCVERGLTYLSCYADMPTCHVATDDRAPEEIAAWMAEKLREKVPEGGNLWGRER